MAGNEAELAFVATMRDEATAVARQARASLDKIGGPTKPIVTDVKVDADQAMRVLDGLPRNAKGAVDETAAAFGRLSPEMRSAVAEASKRAAAEVPPPFEDSGKEAGDGMVRGLVSKVKGAKAGIVGAVAALGLGAAIGEALGMDAANDKLAAGLGAGPKLAARYGKLSAEIYGGAWGESAEQVNQALGAVKSSIAGVGNGPGLKSATTQALDFATIFEVDVVRAASTAGLAVKSGLAGNATEAFDLLTAASQKVPAQLREDVLDASDEYGQFFAGLGFDGPKAFSVLAAGAEKGMYGIDKAGDAIKEFSIRSTDMSTSSKAAYKSIGLDARGMANEILAGGDQAQGATQKIIRGILGIKDPAKQAEAAIALFGTPLEDLNVKDIPAFLQSMEGAASGLGKIEGASKRAGQTLNENASTNLTSFARQAKLTAVNVIGGSLIPMLESVSGTMSTSFAPAVDTAKAALESSAGFLREHKTLSATLATVLGLLVAAFVAVQIGALTASAALSIYAGVVRTIRAVTVAWTAVQWLLNAALAANPIGLLVVALVALGAALAVAWAKSSTFRAIVLGAWNAVKAGVMAAVNAIRAVVSAAWSWLKSATLAVVAAVVTQFLQLRAKLGAAMTAVRAVISKAWAAIRSAVMAAVNAVRAVVVAGFNAVRAVVSSIMGAVGKVISSAWKSITKAVSSAISTVRSVVSSGFDRVRSAISSAMSAAKDLIRRAWDSAVSAVKSGVSNIVSTAAGLIGKVKGALSGAATALYSIGSDLIRGMISGVTNMAGSLLSKVGDVIGGAKAKAKSLLGIASPSKVFRLFGKQTMRGYIVGLVGEKKKVERTLARIFGGIRRYYGRKFKSDRRARAAARRAIRSLSDETAAIRRNYRARAAARRDLKQAPKLAKALVKSVKDATGIFAAQAPNGAPLTAGFIVEGLRSQVEAIRRFRANLDDLRDRGLSRSAIREIEAKGLEEGGAYAAALAAGTDAQLAAVDANRAEVNREANRIGRDSVRGVAAGVRAELRELGKAGRLLAKQLRGAIRKALGIRSPSRVLAVDGRHSVAGLISGVLAAVPDAEAAGRHLAERVEAAAVPSLGNLGRLAADASRVSTTTRVDQRVTIRHEVTSPDGSVDRLTAAKVADLIARDPKAASALERVLRPVRRRKAHNTITASR